MLVVGLSGGIGAGKSAVSNYFESLGVTVVDADVVAREIVAPGSMCLERIAEHFGPDALLGNGELNRAWLRQRIFTTPSERAWLEALTHPEIRKQIVQQLAVAEGTYAILASPLLLESGQNNLVQRVLIVDVPPELQVQRASARDSNSTQQIEKIMAAQLDRGKRLQLADDVIDNSGTLENTQQQALSLHHQYLEFAKKHEY